MFVYHGVVDQATASLVEFINVIIPTHLAVGAPCIVLCYRGMHGQLQGNLDQDSQALDPAAHSFEAVIENMNIAPDGLSATFTTSSDYDLILDLPKDMDILQVSFRFNDDGPPLTSSMNLAMHHPILATESERYVPDIFLGPMYFDNQFEGNIAVLMFSKQEHQEVSGSPAQAFISWNAKTATTAKATPPSLSCISEPQVAGPSQNEEQDRAQFSLNNSSHDFRGRLSRDADGQRVLRLSVHRRHGFFGSSDWRVVAIPELHKFRDTLLKMVAEFGSHSKVIIYNNTVDAVTCTIESSTDSEYGERMATAGLDLGALGLAFALPPPVSIGVAAVGLVIASISWFDTVVRRNTSKSMVLYPHDKMEQIMTGWATNYDIIMIKNYVEEGGRKLLVGAYRGHKVQDRTYFVSELEYLDITRPKPLASIFLSTPQKLSIRRMLGIRGMVPNVNLEHPTYPSPQEGDVLSYDKSGTELGTCYSDPFWKGTGECLFRCTSDAGHVAVVQGTAAHFGPGGDLHVYHLANDPYSPVLCMARTTFVFSGPGKSRRRDIGSAKDNDEALRLIQGHQDRSTWPENWGYCYDFTSTSKTVYAWPWNSKNSVIKARDQHTYFVVDSKSWWYISMLESLRN